MKKRSITKLILCLLPLMIAFFSLSIVMAHAEDPIAYPFRTGANAFQNGKELTITGSEPGAYTQEKMFIEFSPSVAMDKANGYIAIQLESKNLAQVTFEFLFTNTAGSAWVTVGTPESAVHFVSESGEVTTDTTNNNLIDIQAGFRGMVIIQIAGLTGDTSDVNWQGNSRFYTTIDAQWHNGLDIKFGELGYYANNTANLVKFLDLSDANNSARITLEVSNKSTMTQIAEIKPTYAFRTGENAFAYGAEWKLESKKDTNSFAQIAYLFDSQFVAVNVDTDYIAVQIGTERTAWLQAYMYIQDVNGGTVEYKTISESGTVYLLSENGTVSTRNISWGSIVLNAGDRGALIIPLNLLTRQGDASVEMNFSNAWQLGFYTDNSAKFGYNINFGEVGLYKGDFYLNQMNKITTLNSETDFNAKIHSYNYATKTMIAADSFRYPMRTGTEAFKNGTVWSKPVQSETAGSYSHLHTRFASYYSINKDAGYLAMQISTDNAISFIPYFDVLAVGGAKEIRFAPSASCQFYFVNENGTIEEFANSYSNVVVPGARTGMLLVPLSQMTPLYGDIETPAWDYVCVIGILLDGFSGYNPAFNLFLGDIGFYAGDYRSSQLTKIGSKYNDSYDIFGTQLISEDVNAGAIAEIGNIYTITFKNYNGDVLSTIKCLENATVVAPSNPTKPADSVYTYTFNGWGEEVTVATADKEYTATYTANPIPSGLTATYSEDIVAGNKINPSALSITISYADSSSGGVSPLDVEYWYGGQRITDPVNYVFTEQMVGELDIIVKYQGLETTMTVTVVSAIVNYDITYNLDGGEVATANPVTYNENTASFTLINPTKENYTFAGWTGTGLTEPTMEVTISQGSTGDRSYTATWTANAVSLTATYSEDIVAGNKINPSALSITINYADSSSGGVSPLDVEYWYGGQRITDPVNYVFTEQMVGELDIIVKYQGLQTTMTVTVVSAIVNYNITYNLDGGEVATANPVTYNENTASFTLVNPTKEGYTFKGWTGTGLTEPTMEVTIPQGSTGDRSYTATWEENTQGGGDPVTPPPAGDDNDGGDQTPDTTPDTTPEETPEEGGCGSVIGVGALIPAMVAILGAGLVVKAKKKD